MRALLRQRISFIAHCDATRNQLRSLPKEGTPKALVQMLEKTIKHYDQMIERCEKQACRLLKKLPSLARDVAKLTSMFGVGEIGAMTIIAELGDLRRFDSPRKRESGEFKGEEHISKFGNPYVRRMLHMETGTLIQHKKEDNGAWYHRKVGEGKRKGTARTAAMRKLLERMWHVVVRDLEYERFPQNIAA